MKLSGNSIKSVNKHLKASQLIALGFLLVIIVGTILLQLPISSANHTVTPFLTAFFTATSATCVTGLVVVNTAAYWSVFGKVVILIMIQVGGLGFMAIVSAMYMVSKKRITLRERLVIQESFNVVSLDRLVVLVRRALKMTFAVELVGAIMLSLIFYVSYGHGIWKSIYNGVFHSISAFCNAGFDILGSNSLINYSSNIPLNLVIASLIFIGGLGFGVCSNIYDKSNLRFDNGKVMPIRMRAERLSLHTKIAVAVSLILVVLGTVFFLVLEDINPNTLGGLPFGEKLLAAFFHSVSLRTAGFNTIDISQLTDSSKLISIMFMLIGGSPGSAAGGMKTVTFAIVVYVVISVVKGNSNATAFERTIPPNLFKKAFVIVFIYVLIFLNITIVILTIEAGKGFDLLDISFEVASALGTVGLSLGVTSKLSVVSKLIITLCMFIGRIGPITLAVSLTSSRNSGEDLVTYPEENVTVG